MAPPLEGVRILDLSRLLPGPFCTLLLAELGADVVAIEDPRGGEMLRHLPPRLGEAGSAAFHALFRNKRSVALDLRTPPGKRAFFALLGGADVVLEGFRPGVMERLGLDYDALSAARPEIVLCSISGFGQSGPDAKRAGHDLGYQARAGLLGYAGERHGRTESWPGVQIADVAGGSLFGALSILAALRERDRTGRGRHLDISMTEGAAALLHLHLARAFASGHPLARGGEPLNGRYPCYGLYRTSDGRQMALSALEPKFWSAFCSAVQRPDLEARAYERAAIGELEELFAARDFAHWCELSRRIDACLEPVWEGNELLADPQHLARGLFYEFPDDRAPGGSVASLRLALPFERREARPPPGLGEHTEALLREAGVDEDTLRAILAPN